MFRTGKTLTAEDLPKIKEQIAARLQKRGNDVVLIAETIDIKTFDDASQRGDNLATKDFTPLRDKYRLDKLVVIEVAAIGFVRNYSAYVPTSDPKASVLGPGYMIDLHTHR